MSRTISAFVPYLPTTYLSPNRGERKAGRLPFAISGAKMELEANTATWLSNLDAVRALEGPFDYARVSLDYCWTKRKSDGIYRAEDVTNAIYALKAFFDGIKVAGIIKDDGYKHMKLGECRVVAGARHEGVALFIEEIDRPEVGED
jgi:hypothetical protein